MTLKLWDIEQEEALLDSYDHHTEFVVGVDFNIFREGQLATCSWDETIEVFSYMN
jgi:peroxin-7